MTAPNVAFVVRLSRDDLSQPGSLEEKFANRLAICCELTKRYGLPDPASEHILIEQISGRRLDRRAAFRALLDQCETGVITHIVTPYQDRLLRGDKRDEADIEDALLAGAVTLITTEGVIQFDEEYEARHALTFEVRALAARHYLRDVMKKLKEANRQRQRQGQRSTGIAPYGYRWIKPAATQGVRQPGYYELLGTLTLVDETVALAYALAHLPACLSPGGALRVDEYLALARRAGQPDGSLLPGVECTEGEYAVLCDIFRLLPTTGYDSLARSLNTRGIPPPSHTRRKQPGTAWRIAQLRQMLYNPHYAGFPAHRKTTNRRGENIALPPDKWLYSDEEQPYPHPIRLPDLEALQARISERGRTGSPRLTKPTLLSGLLVCAAGQPMHAESKGYTCSCQSDGRDHLGANLYRNYADTNVFLAFKDALDALPATPSPSRKKTVAPRKDPSDLLTLRREIERKKREIEQLRQHAAAFSRAGAADGLTTTLATMEAERRDLEERYKRANQSAGKTEGEEAVSQLMALRDMGIETAWAKADIQAKRAMLGLVFQRLEVVPQDRPFAHVKELRVVVQPWIARYWSPKTFLLRCHRRPHTRKPSKKPTQPPEP